ncbi:hypothetical protein [Streptomyces capitiformicae]|uniref:Peptidase inhibitor family I36 n=1 Tax=Streptomyces capitiformicae TaxID=2014920 RepID=A0A918ZQJ7_9ACTN|nr:hypothetical protein [Streptomyces capitiformicae]GHE63566.1 hypothetical protein GCM10017771_86950 [Streptomyces capitiformicae]
MRRKTLFAATLAAAAVLGAGSATTGQAAAAASAPRGAVATFEGKKTDLSGGWGAAKACGVWQNSVNCFRTTAELDRKATQVYADRTAAGIRARCSSPLELGEHIDLRPNGRILRFYDRGSWQNLTRYNFNNKTSSYRTGACTAHLAENLGGEGNWYPGNTGPNHYERAMSSRWNDRVSSIKID